MEQPYDEFVIFRKQKTYLSESTIEETVPLWIWFDDEEDAWGRHQFGSTPAIKKDWQSATRFHTLTEAAAIAISLAQADNMDHKVYGFKIKEYQGDRAVDFVSDHLFTVCAGARLDRLSVQGPWYGWTEASHKVHR